MRFDEYRRHDATGLAALIARRDVTPREVLDAALARSAAANPTLNAVIVDCAEQAGAAIDDGLPDGPLAGVPFLIKDVTVQMRGTTTGGGSRVFKNAAPATADSALVAAYRGAGLVLFGKTNTPEFGLACVTEPTARGATLNPWNLGHTAGGSSGGAAAAVAAGIVPAAHASDGGGSIRIPASCCGLFGLKPSRGRVSAAPAGEGWGGLSVQHAVTRSVRDSALLLDIACQPQPGDPYWLEAPATPFVQEVGRDPGRLRIAFTTEGLLSPAIDPACVQATLEAAELCRSLGHDVEEARPTMDYSAMGVASNLLVCASIARMLDVEAERRGRPIAEDEVEAVTWLVYGMGKESTGTEFAAAVQAMHRLGRDMARFFETYDVLMLPTLGQPPVAKGYLSTDTDDLEGYAERLYGFMPNTSSFNGGGQPAMSVPLAWSDDGLPLGVQFVARGGAEAVLLRLAGQLEAARPWFDRVAPLP